MSRLFSKWILRRAHFPTLSHNSSMECFTVTIWSKVFIEYSRLAIRPLLRPTQVAYGINGINWFISLTIVYELELVKGNAYAFREKEPFSTRLFVILAGLF